MEETTAITMPPPPPILGTTKLNGLETQMCIEPQVCFFSFLFLRSYFTNSYYLQVFNNDLHDAGYQRHRGKKEKGRRRKQQGKKKKGA